LWLFKLIAGGAISKHNKPGNHIRFR
jgi:hypothetical protein